MKGSVNYIYEVVYGTVWQKDSLEGDEARKSFDELRKSFSNFKLQCVKYFWHSKIGYIKYFW